MSERPRVWPMYRAMVGVGLACGLLIVGVFEWTAPVIERNRAEALQQAIFRVLPDAATSRGFRSNADDGFEPVPDGTRNDGSLIYAGYDASGDLVGVAVEAAGMGYQDVISVIYGYSLERDGIVGVRVLESRETPGLGDRIETDEAFLANFERLDVSLTEDGTALRHPIEAVKHGRKTDAWQVDAITGATISSFAIADILGRSASHWVPRIRRGVDDLRGPVGDGGQVP